MIKLHKVNNETVNPIKLKPIDKKKIKGCNIFEEIYCNVFLCAKKKSGKTSTIFKILKSCASKHSNVLIFCSTVYKDQNWIQIVDWLEKHDIPTITHTSMFEDGINQVKELVRHLEVKDKPKEEKEEVKTKFIQC